MADHPLIKKLTNAKLFDIEGLENGTILPKYSTTRGLFDGMHASHPEYNLYIQKQLNQLETQVKGLRMTLGEAEKEVRQINQKIISVFEDIMRDNNKVDKRINEYFRELNKTGQTL
ncbi:AHH domain-containing protein [Chitinophaga sp. RCC_12]|uniref:AHH domain-containing protein n=1 Tax=Chitinophaga sp. RCC_12 TaxID=3239226 RepID=UPI0035268528